MQTEFLFAPVKNGVQTKDALQIGSQAVPIHFIRNRKARRYIIRVQPDGSIRATVPRVGSIREARAFAERHADWILKQLQKRREHPVHPPPWLHGTKILYRGETVVLEVVTDQDGLTVRFADQEIRLPVTANIRHAVERHLWNLARQELPSRTAQLAALHGLSIKRVTVRNQRSRWGSCSRRGTISLNWRLIQAPEVVQDYLVMHELAHLREMNHSKRFWAVVAGMCPHYRQAEAWLKARRVATRD